ncbi:MAG: hypothetical protein K0V04_40055 [Deltaproteobacteria bacterium]|nr:hypothetical protein [Deltaproteobacteria bacterium]
MQTLRIATVPGVLAVFALSSMLVACGDSKKGGSDGKAPGKTPAAVADGKTPADPVPAADGAAASTAAASDGGGSGGAKGSTGGGDSAGGGSTAAAGGTTGGGTGAASAGADETGGADAAGSSSGGSVDTAALIKEIKNRRTKDERATEAIAEAEAAGVTPKELAAAINLRGQALHASPDRAKVMFELAFEKYPKNPLPAFNLAKQAAVLGELDDAKKWLKVVHERKGKKLLQQVDFDPMWEILKDDPEVRALLK